MKYKITLLILLQSCYAVKKNVNGRQHCDSLNIVTPGQHFLMERPLEQESRGLAWSPGYTVYWKTSARYMLKAAMPKNIGSLGILFPEFQPRARFYSFIYSMLQKERTLTNTC